MLCSSSPKGSSSLVNQTFTTQQQNLQVLWNHPGLASWMTQSSPHSLDSELTINCEAALSQTVTVMFFVTAFVWVFHMEIDAYPLLDNISAFDDKLHLFSCPLFGVYFFSFRFLFILSSVF